MDPRVLGWINAHGGVISRAKALDFGLAPAKIQHLVGSGDWVRVHRGVYTTREIWDALDEYVGRPRLRGRAATLRMTRGWVFSHDSAAHEQGLEILHYEDEPVHVTRPGYTNAWTQFGVSHHLADFREGQVVERDGVRFLDRARTAVDIAREHGVEAGVVACDSARRMGTTLKELWAAVAPMDHWRGAPAARQAIKLCDPRAQTVLESLARCLVIEAGIGDPETQFPLHTPRGVLWCDIRVGNQIIEADGKLKYRERSAGGVATTSAEQVVWDERTRERLIKDEELGVSRLAWADYWGDRRKAAVERLRADYADTVARYGAELHPRLAEQARAIRAELGETPWEQRSA